MTSPEDDDGSRLSTTTTTIRPTAVASALAAARDRAERRLFRRCCSCCCFAPSPPGAAAATAALSSGSGGGPRSSSSPLRAALESLRRVALLGDATLWGAALRAGHLRAAMEKMEGESGGGGGRDAFSSALGAAADDARGAATPAALGALFSREAPLRLSVVLLDKEPDRGGRRRAKGEEEEEEALWSRLTVRRERAAWPLGLLPLFAGGGGGDGTSSSASSCSSSSSDPWRTVESLFSTLLALERASLSLEEAYLFLKSAARGRRALRDLSSSSSSFSTGGEAENALLSLWRAHRDASFAVRGALSHLREDVLAPADRELDAALLRLEGAGAAGAAGAGAAGAAGAGAAGAAGAERARRPLTLAAAALRLWSSRVASSPLSLSSPSSSSPSGPVAEALAKLCRACHALRGAVELASFLEGEGEEEEEQQQGGEDARALAAASATALLGAASAAGEAARALAAAAAAEAPPQPSRVPASEYEADDDLAAAHRAMLLGRVSFG